MVEKEGYNTKDEFIQLIKKKKWHVGTGLTTTIAYKQASRFRDGSQISIENTESVLEKTATVIQKKIWKL